MKILKKLLYLICIILLISQIIPNIIYHKKLDLLKKENNKIESKIENYQELKKEYEEYNTILEKKNVINLDKEELEKKINELNEEITKLEKNNNYYKEEISKLS